MTAGAPETDDRALRLQVARAEDRDQRGQAAGHPGEGEHRVGPALWASTPAMAAPAAAPAADEVNSQEKASVCVPAGAKRSTMA